MNRRILAVVLTAAVFLTARTTVLAATVADSGACGDGMTWVLDSDSLLSVSGGGAMQNYVQPWLVPWYRYREEILTVEARSGVTAIGNNAFFGCTDLTAVSTARSVRSIGDHAFEGCTALTELNLSERLTSVGTSAFADCAALTDPALPVTVASIGQGAFRNCTGLTELDLPVRLDRISPYLFEGCTNLERVGIPQGTDAVGIYAFQNCESLSSVTIPASVDSIGDYAFDGCYSLRAVYYASSERSWRQITSELLREQLEELGTRVYYDGRTEDDPEVPSFPAVMEEVSVSGTGVSVRISGEPAENSVLIAASYDPEGRMLDARPCDSYADQAGQYYVSVNLVGAETIAAFLLGPDGKPDASSVRAQAAG